MNNAQQESDGRVKSGYSDEDATPHAQLNLDRPFQLGDWLVDPNTNRLKQADTEVRLEPKVMRVLVLLAQQHGKVVSRRHLEETIWPKMLVTDDAVTSTLIKLRKALGDDARKPAYIQTIPKSGYRLIAEPTPPAAEAGGISSSVLDPPAVGHPNTRGSRRNLLLLLLPVLLIVLLIGWFASRKAQISPTDSQSDGLDRPVIAVLPFENLSADPEQNYFANGITEDLITDLSKLSGLQVVARNSVYAYRNSPKSERQIGQELGARYIVKGSVQRAGDRLRMNVRLTDAKAGRNRWAERYDRNIADIFRIQDEIGARMVSALQIELAPGEQQRLMGEYASDVEAYDEYLLGLDLLGRRASASNPAARAHFERAIELEPGFARAYAGLAMTYALESVYGAGPEVLASLSRAEEIARHGLEIDDTVPQLRYALGMVETYRGNLQAAIKEVRLAIELRPSYADAYGLLAWILHFAGRPDEGLQAMQQAITLSPHISALYRTVLAALYYEKQEFAQALQLLEASVEMNPSLLQTRLYLAAVYAATDQMEAAQWEIDEIYTLDPDFSLDPKYGYPPIRDPRYLERFMADLRNAGLQTR